MRRRLSLILTFSSFLLAAAPAHAQLNGSHSLGDFGVQSGSQPATRLLRRAFLSSLRHRHHQGPGRQHRPPRSEFAGQHRAQGRWLRSLVREQGQAARSELRRDGRAPLGEWRRWKRRRSQSARTVDTSFSDVLIRPLDLGWHSKGADVTAGFQFYAPTGRTSAAAATTSGKACGRTSRFVGMTVYFDEKRTVSLATTAFWEFHGNKKDTNTKVGQLLTLEGGVGKSYLGGGLVVGAAYYAQWKLTEDQLAQFVLPGGGALGLQFPNKHRVYAFGPDVTLPVASKAKLFTLVNIRYLWETGARVKTAGPDAGNHGDVPGPQRQAAMNETMTAERTDRSDDGRPEREGATMTHVQDYAILMAAMVLCSRGFGCQRGSPASQRARLEPPPPLDRTGTRAPDRVSSSPGPRRSCGR